MTKNSVLESLSFRFSDYQDSKNHWPEYQEFRFSKMTLIFMHVVIRYSVFSFKMTVKEKLRIFNIFFQFFNF